MEHIPTCGERYLKRFYLIDFKYSIFTIINKIIYKNDSAQYHQNYIFVQALEMYKLENESQKVKEVRAGGG